MSKILMMNIATNKYTMFVDNFYESCKKFFATDQEVSYLLFTNHMDFETSVDVPLKKSFVEHKPFPEPTIKRYHYFLQERDYLNQFDYVFYSDIDMQFVGEVSGEEICHDLTLTLHPCIREKHMFTYDGNPESTAYIDNSLEGTNYFCGGFNGGSSKHFVKLAESISKNVDTDEQKNVVALWHDESHLNRYAIDNPPNKIIDWCVTDMEYMSSGAGKLACLTKDSAEVRSD